MAKRLTMIVLGILLLFTALAACSGTNNADRQPTQTTQTPPATQGTTESETPPEPVTISFAWWGSETRHNATLAMIDLFQQKYPHVTVETEYGGFDGFIDKYRTRLVAGQGTDILFAGPWDVDTDYYHDIEDFPQIRLEHIHPVLLEASRINGKIKYVPTQIALQAIIYNKTLFQELGIEEPQKGWTYEDFAAKAKEITEKSNGAVYGSQDQMGGGNIGSDDAFYQHVRAISGKPVYSETGLAYSDEDARTVLQFWKDLRDNGYTPTPELSASFDDDQNSPIINRTVGMMQSTISVYPRHRANTQDELAIIHLPTGPHSNNALEVTDLITINKTSKHPDDVANFIDMFVNDLEAAKILKTVRGISTNSEVQQMHMNNPDLDELSQEMFAVTNEILTTLPVHEKDPIAPGHPEFAYDHGVLDQVLQKLAFNQVTVDEAVAELRELGEAVYKRAQQ